jgi:hypothetical protein
MGNEQSNNKHGGIGGIVKVTTCDCGRCNGGDDNETETKHKFQDVKEAKSYYDDTSADGPTQAWKDAFDFIEQCNLSKYSPQERLELTLEQSRAIPAEVMSPGFSDKSRKATADQYIAFHLLQKHILASVCPVEQIQAKADEAAASQNVLHMFMVMFEAKQARAASRD